MTLKQKANAFDSKYYKFNMITWKMHVIFNFIYSFKYANDKKRRNTLVWGIRAENGIPLEHLASPSF